MFFLRSSVEYVVWHSIPAGDSLDAFVSFVCIFVDMEEFSVSVLIVIYALSTKNPFCRVVKTSCSLLCY